MTGSEIRAFNLGRERYESIVSLGADRTLDYWLKEHLRNGDDVAAYEALGPTVFKRWMLRGAGAKASGDVD